MDSDDEKPDSQVLERRGIRYLLRPPHDPENLRLALELMDLTQKPSRFRYVPGVRKFRSVEEMDAHRRAWEEAETRRLRGEA
jgi:hypothetical protein